MIQKGPNFGSTVKAAWKLDWTGPKDNLINDVCYDKATGAFVNSMSLSFATINAQEGWLDLYNMNPYLSFRVRAKK